MHPSASTEFGRLEALRSTGLLDSRPETAYDAIVAMASDVVGAPIALVSLVDRDRQWFKARVGLDATETPREVAFCSHAIDHPASALVVEDTLRDERFQENPLVLGDPGIRFYAGFPIVDDGGHALGTLCVIDRQPRSLDAPQMARLRTLADIAQELIRLRALATDLDSARRQATLFERGFDAAGIGMQLVGRDGRMLRVNRAFAEMIGREVDDVVGRRWWELTHPEQPGPDEELERQIDDGAVAVHRSVGRYLHLDGSTVTAVVHVVPVWFDGSSERVNFVQVTNITEAVEAQHRIETARGDLQRSERRLASLIEPSPDPMLLVGGNGIIEAANPAAAGALSAGNHSLVGRRTTALAVRADLYRQVRSLVRDALVTGEQRTLDQVWFEPFAGPAGWFRLRVLPVLDVDGAPSTFITATNITEAVENEQRLAALALVDPLTGAANRAALYDRLEQALVRLERSASAGVAVAMIDLDHFKALNDTHGHDTGDAALVGIVTALRSVVRANDTVARLGGDEFIVMFDDVDETETTNLLAPRLVEQFLRVAVPVHGTSVKVTGSVGVAWTATRTGGRDLIARADAALLHAKRHGRNRIWFAADSAGESPFSSDMALRRDLALALERRQFSLRYQPIVDAHDRVTAVEALLRWEHPEHGTLEPAAFMGTLVENGLISSVGQWVLHQAIADASHLNSGRPDAIAVHVNLSPGEVASTHVPGLLRRLLADHGVDPATIVIEVTEQALMGTIVSSSSVAELAATGVRLALDDFGTGTSSLAHLRHRPLHGLKLDRTFVAGIGHDKTDMAIVSGTIGIAQALGIEVVAEGVETPRQREWLRAQQCSHLQGWLTGRPVRLEELRLD